MTDTATAPHAGHLPSPVNDGHVHLGMTVRDPDRRPDEAALLAEIDRYGVGQAAVITPAACGWDNGLTIAAVRSHPDRFVGVARIDVGSPSAARECAALLDDGLHGVRLDVRGDGDVLRAASTGAVATVLQERGAVLDLHASADEIDAIARLAEHRPELTILVDHGGRPTAAELDTPATSPLAPLVPLANVVIKTPNASAFSATPPPHGDLAPFHSWLVHAFGAHRVLWGSDWPVCPDDSSYGAALTAASAALTAIPTAAAAAVLRDTFNAVFGRPASGGSVSGASIGAPTSSDREGTT